MERYDLFFDKDLVIENNDLSYQLSDQQHVEDTINAVPGWWKESFTDGVSIVSYLNSSGQEQVLARSIKIQLESDLYSVNNPQIKYSPDGKLYVNPNATI
jgi:hypothetical protein